MKKLSIVFLAAAVSVPLHALIAKGGVVSPVAEQTRTVYLSATDGKGAPVGDLTAADITVKEAGKDRQVVSLKAATAPMQIALIVDDNGGGGYQAAVAQLVQGTLDRAQFSIRVLTPQALVIQDYTQDVGALRAAVAKLGPRGKIQADPEQIVEGISDATKELLARKAERPVIVVMTIAGDNTQSGNIDVVMDRLRNSRAMLNVLMLSSTPAGRILGDGPKISGGRNEAIGGGGGIAPAVAKIVDHLTHQYELSYSVPEGVKPSDRVSIATSRKGVSLVAPTRMPDR